MIISLTSVQLFLLVYKCVNSDLFRFRGLFVAGEHCDKETLEFARSVLKAPILDNWWQTGKPSSSSKWGSHFIFTVAVDY